MDTSLWEKLAAMPLSGKLFIAAIAGLLLVMVLRRFFPSRQKPQAPERPPRGYDALDD